MTNNEFKTWWSDFSATFPDVDIWVTGLHNCQEILCRWAGTLDKTELVDATAVTKAMAEFRIDQIGTTDHERGGTGRIVARHSRAFAAERLQREHILTAGQRGDGRDRTYRCQKCLDRGLVTVVNPVHWNRRRLVVDDMNVRCNCDAGERFKSERTGVSGQKFRPVPEYDRNRHFRAMEGITQEVREDFMRWLQSDERKAAAAVAAGPEADQDRMIQQSFS